MNCIIPFTKDIKFKSNIVEVSSISLEHDYTVNDNEILGNFVINGEYRTHEVSVNREKFEYVLPFSVNLTKPIVKESFDFNIEDFTYELLESDTLKINIEYSIKGEEIEEREEFFEKVEEEICEEKEELEELIAEYEEEKVEEETIDEINFEEEQIEDNREVQEEIIEIEDVIRDEEQSNMIVNTLNNNEEDTYVTYHIHMLKENETIETVCSLYKTNQSVLENYNDLKNLVVGDKIIIPGNDE